MTTIRKIGDVIGSNTVDGVITKQLVVTAVDANGNATAVEWQTIQ